MGNSGRVLRDPSYLPRVVAMRHVHDHVLWLRFDDGLEGEVDLSGDLHGSLLAPLRDASVFSQVGLQFGTLSWPGDLDWSPETLYEQVAATKRSSGPQIGAAAGLRRAYIGSMPEISRFYGIVIRMLGTEHDPPQFHAVYGEFEISVTLRGGEVRGHFPKRALRLVLEWHDRYERELMEHWNRLRAGDPARAIPPLP